jgi:hypothetical protein
MPNKYKCVPFDSLKDGEMILAFGCHVTRWDFDLMGDPAYGFVPSEENDQQFQDQQEWIRFDYDDEDTFPEDDGFYGVIYWDDGQINMGADYYSADVGFNNLCVAYYCKLILPPLPEEEK